MAVKELEAAYDDARQNGLRVEITDGYNDWVYPKGLKSKVTRETVYRY